MAWLNLYLFLHSLDEVPVSGPQTLQAIGIMQSIPSTSFLERTGQWKLGAPSPNNANLATYTALLICCIRAALVGRMISMAW